MPYRRLIQKQQFFIVVIYVDREECKKRREGKESEREAINGPTR
jgi:hypothetical protein